MRESSVVVRPVPESSSEYRASTRLEAAGLRRGMRRFETAAAAVPLPAPPQPVIIADYGAATGHNSLLPIGSAIEVLRTRIRPEHSVFVAHTDLPDNDFTALFRTLGDDPDTYLKRFDGVFAAAVGRSFYQQILPSNSVTLGWSSWAVQWLRKVPSPVPDHIVAACSADERVRAAYARQGAQDWHDFVAFRGRELAPGGRVVVLTMALDENGDLGHRGVLDALRDALTELRADGLLGDDELHRMGLPIVGRSRADLVAPFAPSGRLERVEIEELEVFDAEDRYYAQYRADSDARAFGAKWAAFGRAAVFPALVTALDGTDPRLFCDRLEAAVAARLAAAPQPARIPMAQVVLVKRAAGGSGQ